MSINADGLPKHNEVIEFDEEIKFPLYSINLNLKTKINSTIYRSDKYHILHRIGIWPNEMQLQYATVNKCVMLIRAMYLCLPAGTGYPLKWGEDGIFKLNIDNNHYIGMGGTLDEDHILEYCPIKGWKEYFEIKEVKEFLKENYNINSEDLFSLT